MLRFCCYVLPRASGGFVGRPVLVGDGTSHDVVTNGGVLVAFLGVGAGVASVDMSNAVAMRPAVERRVRIPLLIRVVYATPPSVATPGFGCKLVVEGLDLVGESGV
jgi:hypothetical protein